MSENEQSAHRSSKRLTVTVLTLAALVAILAFFARPLARFIEESRMQSVTSAHYEILSPRGAPSPEAMRQFVSRRESLFTALDKKLGDSAASAKVRIIFYRDSSALMLAANEHQPYLVTGTTIRTKLTGQTPLLDSSADGEAILYAAWGKPGNPRIRQWAGMALVGEWHGEELGMAAAGAEQRLGQEKLSTLLNPGSREISSPGDRALLGAAWVSEIAEFGGATDVRKLYSAKNPNFDESEAAKTLGTTPMELDRKWQLWMYAYLAGMPSASPSMPMNMQMPDK